MNPLPRALVASTMVASVATWFTEDAFAETPAHYGVDALARLDRLPYLSSDISAGQMSSNDRSGDNNDQAYYPYTAANGERVMLDFVGPGVVYDIWSTGWNYGADHIKAYFDDETTPRMDMIAGDFWSGTAAGFPAPLSVNDQVSSGGFISYVPLPFAHSIRITTTGGSYYHVGYQTFAPDAQITSWTSGQDLSAANAIWKKVGADPKPTIATTEAEITFDLGAGQTQTLLDIAGPRAIEQLRIKIPELGPPPMSVIDVLIHGDGWTDGGSVPIVHARRCFPPLPRVRRLHVRDGRCPGLVLSRTRGGDGGGSA